MTMGTRTLGILDTTHPTVAPLDKVRFVVSRICERVGIVWARFDTVVPTIKQSCAFATDGGTRAG